MSAATVAGAEEEKHSDMHKSLLLRQAKANVGSNTIECVSELVCRRGVRHLPGWHTVGIVVWRAIVVVSSRVIGNLAKETWVNLI